MGLSEAQLRAGVDALGLIEPCFAAAVDRVGYPPTRIRDRGYATLLRTIIGQQVSVKAADSMYRKFVEAVGDADDPAAVTRVTDEELRAAGMSRQKSSYIRSLSEEITSGRLDFDDLPADDEEAITELVRIKGIGRWSAEIYLLFAEGRPDIWPAGDLAVQIEVGRILGHESRPSEKLTRELAEAWRPHRGAAAIFAWHHYGAGADAAPV
ncbi:DNA-3-methyladenine glycosylase family protein [Sphingomonas radiodurans]|uniref:DNA-3-methyladenine glycosylase family protein n=1 Tax=Sphingomonas radiodurans TaxID=2890321 RepID=UPI001E3B0438|nr:DNA-3-methyladenine glycosylase 2 family protein [Sphingomonas radiodurans]WBH16507.1 DNA-3-methyladenine glycosylase 2 family protein [Sphingomonas radiodurans]